MRVAVRLGHGVGEGQGEGEGQGVVGMRMVAGYDCL